MQVSQSALRANLKSVFLPHATFFLSFTFFAILLYQRSPAEPHYRLLLFYLFPYTHTHTHTTQGLGCLPSSFFFYNFCVYTFSTSCEFRFFAAIGRHKIHLHSLSISPALSFALRLLTCQGLSVTLRIIRPAALDSCSAFLALTPSFLTYTCYTELYNTTTHNTT